MDQQTINSFRKYFRSSLHIQFLNACIANQVVPKFCRIPDKIKNSTLLSPNERNNLEKRKLLNALETKTQNSLLYSATYNSLKNSLSPTFNSETDFSHFINKIENTVKKSENKFNISRDQKLAKLISEKIPYYTKA